MQGRLFWTCLPILSFAAFVGLIAFVPLVLADGEQWVRTYRGGDLGAPDRALGLVIHESGEITAVGLSCKDLLVLRIDREGNELWSRRDVDDYYYPNGVSAIASGEDVIVSITRYFPYLDYFTDIYRYDRLGNEIWESGTASLSTMVPDGAGGAFLAGYAINDLCPCPGFISRLRNDGSYAWGRHVQPAGFPQEVQTGNINVVAVDQSYVYGAGTVSGETLTWPILTKYTLTGELQWERQVLPGEELASISWIAPASDSSLAVLGYSSTGPWIGRYASNGDLRWRLPWSSSPLLTAEPSGVIYAASQVPGPTGGSDIRLTALSAEGTELWETTFDSGTGSEDAPSALAIDHKGSIVLLTRSNGFVLLVRYHTSGAFVSSDILGNTPPNGTSLALDANRARAFAFGGIDQGTCCDASTDLVVASYDKQHGGPHVVARYDRPASPLFSRGSDVQVGMNGEVVSAVRTDYGCATSLDLVGHGPNGQHNWTRAHPEGAIACFHGSHHATVACKHGETITAARYEQSGALVWAQGFQSGAGYAVAWLAPSPDDGVLIVDSFAQSTILIAVDGSGHERWRRSVEGTRVVKAVVAPDNRIYMHGWTSDLMVRIDCLNESGDLEWTRILDRASEIWPYDMSARLGGILYVTGQVYSEGRYNWVTWRFDPGGKTGWVASEAGGSGNHFLNQPIRVRSHPEGGVVVSGSIQPGPASDALVVRYSEDGSVLWRAGLDTEPAERCYDMTVDRIGNVLVVMDEGNVRIRTVKYGPDGAQVWNRSYMTGGGSPHAVGVGPDLSVAVVGRANDDSAFIIKYEDAAPVTISRFAAERRGSDILVSWEVAPGLEPVGFDLFFGSSPDRVDTRLNSARISAETRSALHRAAPPDAHYYLLVAHGRDGSILREGPVLASTSWAPERFWMTGPSPNPTRSIAVWEVAMPVAGQARLAVHDAAGRTVAKVMESTLPAGIHRVSWDARLANGAPASAGVYFYRLFAAGEERTGKLVLQPPH